MTRKIAVVNLLAPCAWFVCTALASGAGCLIFSGDTHTEDGIPDTGDGNTNPSEPILGSPIEEITWNPSPAPVRGTADRGNADGEHGCERVYQHYEHSPGQGTQLHVVGIYEPPHGSTIGEVNVHVSRPGTSVLVLSSFDEAIWNVTRAPGVTIERVIVNGHYAQEATVPDGVAVEIHSYEQTGSHVGDTGYKWPSHRTDVLINQVEALTGLQLTSFRGCYRSTGFHIAEPGELRPPHPISKSTEPGSIAGCEHLAEESNYCLAIDGVDGHMFMLGLDSGEVCFGPRPDLDLVKETALGWVGDYMYTCVRERGLARISIVDGSVDIAPLACEMVTSYQGGLLVLLSVFGNTRYLVRYDNFAAVVENQPERAFLIGPYADHLATNGERVYTSATAGGSIDTAILRDGAAVATIPLENYSTWIYGLDVTDDGQLIVGGPRLQGGLHIFDADTGDFRKIMRSQNGAIDLAGIECVSGDPRAQSEQEALRPPE